MSATATLPPPVKLAGPPTAGWILSWWADALCFVGTPLLIVPVVWMLRQWFSSEQIWLAAISFFSVGHHLPGFLRSYGDADLFARFRWRLLLMPPLIFTVAWWCEVQGLHGLRVLVLLWATWHGLMQTYGFMRIYDLKRGVREASASRFDFWLCVSVFVWGTVASPARLFGILQAVSQSGLTLPAASHIQIIVWLVQVLCGGVVLAYVGHLAHRILTGLPVAWTKVGLAATTAGIWWLCGLTDDTLIGVAMFEIFHAVQYLAIVWVFYQKTVARWSGGSGWWSKFARRHGALLSLYLGLIAAFGALRYFSEGNLPPGWTSPVLALLATSTLMHYYLDGFIWKVRERQNQEQLGLKAAANSSASLVPALQHVGKWALFFGPLLLLATAERERTAGTAQLQHRLQTSATLVSLFFTLPAAHQLQADAALDSGDYSLARRAAAEAVRFNPRSATACATLAGACRDLGDFSTALSMYQQAVAVAPEDANHRLNLALVLREVGRWDEASHQLQQAAALGLSSAAVAQERVSLNKSWSATLLDSNQPDAALPLLQQASLLAPADNELARLALLWAVHPKNQHPVAITGRQLAENQAWDQAAHGLTELMHQSVEPSLVCLVWGQYWAATGEVGQAELALKKAVELDPQLAEAHLELGRLLWQLSQAELLIPQPRLGPSRATSALHHLRQASRLGLSLPADLQTVLDENQQP